MGPRRTNDARRSASRRVVIKDIGVIIDGRKAGPRTPLDDGATLAFFGNPQWHVGYRPPGPIPPEVFVFALRSVPPSSAPRWEVASPLVSREHCALEYDAQRGSIIVTELGSTFGTAVDGVSLDGQSMAKADSNSSGGKSRCRRR